VSSDSASLQRPRTFSALDGWSFGLTVLAVLLAKAGWLAGFAW
jgi:hypothetical protein